jgi:hypothetical protein
MRSPVFALLSLAIPAAVAAIGYHLARNAKGSTNLGEAVAPFFAAAAAVVVSAVFGELAAVASLLRAERLAWVSWVGVAVNGALLMPAIYLLLTWD